MEGLAFRTRGSLTHKFFPACKERARGICFSSGQGPVRLAQPSKLLSGDAQHMDHLKVCLLVATAWFALAAAGHAFPKVETNLTADKSAVIVTGSNTGAQGYRCSIAGRISIEGQRAFQPLQCNFSLPGNTPTKQMCEVPASGGGLIREVGGVKMTCVPQ